MPVHGQRVLGPARARLGGRVGWCCLRLVVEQRADSALTQRAAGTFVLQLQVTVAGYSEKQVQNSPTSKILGRRLLRPRRELSPLRP